MLQCSTETLARPPLGTQNSMHRLPDVRSNSAQLRVALKLDTLFDAGSLSLPRRQKNPSQSKHLLTQFDLSSEELVTKQNRPDPFQQRCLFCFLCHQELWKLARTMATVKSKVGFDEVFEFGLLFGFGA